MSQPLDIEDASIPKSRFKGVHSLVPTAGKRWSALQEGGGSLECLSAGWSGWARTGGMAPCG